MHVIILGNGISGLTVARTLQTHCPDLEITMYTDEPYLYYPRPRLYDVLSGKITPSAISPFDITWYHQQGIHIRSNTTVTAIDPACQLIQVEGGDPLSYDRLVIAMGAHSFLPPIEGVHKSGVFTLRTLHDAIRIKTHAKPRGYTTIIGGGLLGLETAVALTKLGQHVHVVELLSHLLPRQLDTDGAMILQQHIESHGIQVALGTRTHQITGQSAVSGALLDNGQHLPSSLIIVSAGVRPNLAIAEHAGIKTHKGILVDSRLRTSTNHIYACGNVAEFQGHVYETIPAAIEQATHAAHSILESEQHEYHGTTPANTLQIAGIDLTSIGNVNPEGPHYDVFTKIDHRHGIYTKLILDQNVLIGAIVVGAPTAARQIRRLMHTSVTSKIIHDLLQ